MAKSTNTQETTETVETVENTNQVPLNDKGEKTSVDLSMEQIEELGLKKKSPIIRYLRLQCQPPYSRSAVAKFLDIRVQHVRNVEITPLKGAVTQK